MAYIRNRNEELTGYQNAGSLSPKIDVGVDFVMAYGLGANIANNIKSYSDAGYVVHLMTGIAWGGYFDYLYGSWDGREHLDEVQEDRNGNQLLHGRTEDKIVPYMVPTVTFADYITEKIKVAVDAGVVAVHVEEPEFWDEGGYSPAFKREFLMYYGTPWVAPHTSPDARYKCAKLKAYLYKRTIDRVSAAVKNYALTKYGRSIRFYVPTHSLYNYCQWRIVSPEALLTEVPTVDGYIAQIWTGTSRCPNAYEGVLKERTLETSYMEYGVMQELVKGTGRKMWFLHDPIEDDANHDWNDYRRNYYKTVTASLLHSRINTYEVCPWPGRVFYGKYPSGSENPLPIPEDYTTLLNNTFQMLGDMPSVEPSARYSVGILMSDTALYQRNLPDGIVSPESEFTGPTAYKDEQDAYEKILFTGKGNDDIKQKYCVSGYNPNYNGLSLPLLKHGMPIHPVLLDNARRFVGYLNDYKVLVATYEFCKPEYPDENAALATWVMEGGTLIYVGDGFDPYNRITSFWTGKYDTPADHLFSLLGVAWPEAGKTAEYKVGKGSVCIWRKTPCEITYSRKAADEWRSVFSKAIKFQGYDWEETNYLMERRGPYLIAAVLDENEDISPVQFTGLYADMYSPDFSVLSDPSLAPGENRTYFDFSEIEKENLRIIGTSARIFSMEEKNGTVVISGHASADVKVNIRLRTPYPVACDNAAVNCDPLSRTVLVSFDGKAEDFSLVLCQNGNWQ